MTVLVMTPSPRIVRWLVPGVRTARGGTVAGVGTSSCSAPYHRQSASTGPRGELSCKLDTSIFGIFDIGLASGGQFDETKLE